MLVAMSLTKGRGWGGWWGSLSWLRVQLGFMLNGGGWQRCRSDLAAAAVIQAHLGAGVQEAMDGHTPVVCLFWC